MELQEEQLSLESIHTLSPMSQQSCPECGAPMTEADRLSENGVLYIWYQCSRSSCDGS